MHPFYQNKKRCVEMSKKMCDVSPFPFFDLQMHHDNGSTFTQKRKNSVVRSYHETFTPQFPRWSSKTYLQIAMPIVCVNFVLLNVYLGKITSNHCPKSTKMIDSLEKIDSLETRMIAGNNPATGMKLTSF